MTKNTPQCTNYYHHKFQLITYPKKCILRLDRLSVKKLSTMTYNQNICIANATIFRCDSRYCYSMS